jgi:hypothetical protein
MQYPFENFRASEPQSSLLDKKFLQVAAVMPEFFRGMAVAHTSIDQKNLYGRPGGIRQDLGVETSLKLLLIACCNDRLITSHESARSVIEKLRVLTLLYYAKTANLKACLFFGYYFYGQHANAQYVVKNILAQNDFLVGLNPNSHDVSERTSLLKGLRPHAWYRTQSGIGDKLSDVFILDGDFIRTDLPHPGFQIHFRKSGMYDIRAPIFLETSEVETPLINQGKVIVSCPQCGQKCRGALYSNIEVTCPKCSKKWTQKT